MVVGSAGAFVLAVVVIVVWAATGPIFHFSNTWQLIINTATTISTFLVVFLIQNSQNRDARAIQLKLDELLRAIETARTGLADIEERSDEELDAIQKRIRETGGLESNAGVAAGMTRPAPEDRDT